MKQHRHRHHPRRKQGPSAQAGFVLKALPAAVALCFCPLGWAGINDSVVGLPINGVVSSGTATGAVSGNQLTINQTSNRAVIDWSSFNISAGNIVQFVQPGASSAVLNRVSASANMSQIDGQMKANGAVLLMNPNGVMFGSGAEINVGSLIVTTGTVNATRFMDVADGAIEISGAATGSVINKGSITAQNAGLVAMVAPSVANQGAILARGGKVLLGGASAATISLNGGLYEFVTGASDVRVSNSGTIQADGGSVILSAASASAVIDNVINMNGVIQAGTVGTQGGAIVLEAIGGGVQVAGRLDARGEGGTTGGKITVTGNSVDLTETARLDTSGDTGGGTILVGGNWQGKGPEHNAQTTTVAAGATLRADAIDNGNGGKVVVWADGTTRFKGEISARGGAAGGDGGLVEVSGKQALGFAGAVDTSAANGNTGSLLLDPVNAVISNDLDGSSGDTDTIKASTLVSNLNSNNITIQADSKATVNADVDASGNTNAHNLIFNAATVDLNAAITLKSGASLSGTATTVNVNGSNARIQNGVDVAASGATVNVAAGTYTQTSTLKVNKSVALTGAGEATTTIDARGVTSATGSYGMSVSADDVTLSNFTFYGPSADFGAAYGIKVSPSAETAANRLRNFSIRNVTSRGAGRAEIDLNGVDGALIDNVTLNGKPVDNSREDSKGAGLQITDSANVTVRNTTTLNNNWGGLALYQANIYYNQQVNNITIEGNNHFNEFNPVYMQDQSALYDFGSLSIAGFDYAVRNATNSDSNQYTWLQTTKQKAYDLAVNSAVINSSFSGNASYIQGWDGSAKTQSFEVGVGNLSAGGSQAMSIARAINQASSGATINVGAGTYAEQLSLNKANLTLSGQAGAKVVVPDQAEVNGIQISANNVTVEGLEIAGPVTSSYLSYAWGSNISRGIAVGDGVTGFTIRNNNIHDLRNGILIHGRNSTGTVSNNRIENTKSGISVQYTDASGITISGNSEGTFGNEWGLNLHLNGHLDGLNNILSNSTPIAAAPTTAWQQSLLSLSTANSDWTVQDQGYTSSNRTQVTVATTGAASNQGSQLNPIDSIQSGVNAVVSGGKVKITAGEYTQSSTLNVSKSLTLIGAGEAATTIDARSITGNYGMNVSADDVTLSDFTFYGPSAYFASAYGIKVSPGGTPDVRLHNFTIKNVTSRGAGKAELDLNGVDGALIDNVTLNGKPVDNSLNVSEGAGLQITDSANVRVRNTTTLNNNWGGLALYQANKSYNQQVNNITIEGNNHFNELNPVYMQDESASQDFGTLNIAGFSYGVRNSASTDSGQYTWLQSTQQKAYDFAVNLPSLSSSYSYVQGWSGSALTQNFAVGVGNLTGGGTQAMSIARAIDQSSSGASINVGAGTYAENLNITKELTLNGAGMGQTILQSAAAGSGDAIRIDNASGVTLADFSIADYAYGLRLERTSNNVTVNRVAFNNNTYGMRNSTTTKADNFRMLNSTITGGQIGVQTYNGYEMVGGIPVAKASFSNALFDNVTVDGPTFKGFYFETANNLTLKDVTVTNAGNYGAPSTSSQHMQYGSAIDINLKYDVFDAINLQNVVVRNSGHSSGDASRAAVVIKTRGIPGDSTSYTPAPASLQSVNIIGGSIEGSDGVGLRVETLSNGAGGQSAVTISGGTRFENNGQDIAVDNTRVDARGAVFTGAADGFAIEDRVTHALDGAGRGLVTWEANNVYVTQASGSVQRGVDAAASGNTVNVASGTYSESVSLNSQRDLRFNDATLNGLTFDAGAADSGISGKVTASTATGITFAAQVKLLGDTTLATNGANIALNGDVQNEGATPYALTLTAGSGATRGDVSMKSGGAEGNSLGRFEVTSRQFALSDTGTLRVKSYKIDAQGDVALSNNTLKATDAGGTSTLNASGNVTGSTTSSGDVAVAARNITGSIGGRAVTATAQETLNATVTASQSASLAGNIIKGSVTAPVLTANAGSTMDLAVDVTTATVRAGLRADITGRASTIGVDAPKGSLGGTFGKVDVLGTSVVDVNGKPTVDPVVPPTIYIPPFVPPPPPPPPAPLPPAPITVSNNVDIGSLPPTAAGGGSGAPSANTPSSGGAKSTPSSTSATGGGESSSSGTGESSSGSKSSTGSSTSSGDSSPASGESKATGGTQVAAVSSTRQVTVTRSSPSGAGAALAKGGAVELDLSPGNNRGSSGSSGSGSGSGSGTGNSNSGSSSSNSGTGNGNSSGSSNESGNGNGNGNEKEK